ncbi:MAG: C39 family peptidase [Halobacteriota archaeon]|nr:C39 family peptidase [Halobacteriota archaeon]
MTKDGKAIGEMEMAASKVLGCLLNRIIVSEPLDRDAIRNDATEIVEKEFPDYKILSIKPVCYSYPKEGVMATLVKTGAKEGKTVILDTYTPSVVPLKEPKKDGDIGAWSIYDKIPDKERAEMVKNWNELQKITTMGGKSTRGSKTLSVTKYAQEYSNWCAAATGQMIAKYHGYTHSQSLVADYMDLDPGYGGGAVSTDQLYYYHNGINKVYSHKDPSPSFGEQKTEIDANRPFKGGIPGHARCGRGYSESALGDYVYINDPWPVNIGAIYWEWWGLRTHDWDLHVF